MINRIVNWLLFILSLVIYGLCVYGCLLEYGGGEWQSWLCGIAAAVCYPVAVALHEGGHALFGLAAKIKATPQFRALRPSSCKISPLTDENLKARLIVTASGGLAVNLLFVILGVLALFVRGIPVGISVVLPASFYCFALNALPLELPDGKTDGLVICELARGSDSSKVMLAVLKVQVQVLGGKPISEVDESLLFGLPQIREDDQSFIALTELRYEYFRAKGDGEKAAKYAERLEELKIYLDE